MNFFGVLIGLFCFIVIGVFHPVVVKCEYYFSSRVWPVFLVMGIILLLISILVQNLLGSTLLSVTGFTCLWSIGELREQEERVSKGWFPQNPKRKKELK